MVFAGRSWQARGPVLGGSASRLPATRLRVAGEPGFTPGELAKTEKPHSKNAGEGREPRCSGK